MVTILVMSAKMATPDFLKIKDFWKISHDFIISVHDVTNKTLSRDLNYNLYVVMSSNFGNSSISVREVIITSISWEFDKKNCFFQGWSWFKFNNLGLVLGTNLKLYTSVKEGSKLKVRKFWRLIPTFAEVTGEKLVGWGSFYLPHPKQG